MFNTICKILQFIFPFVVVGAKDILVAGAVKAVERVVKEVNDHAPSIGLPKIGEAVTEQAKNLTASEVSKMIDKINKDESTMKDVTIKHDDKTGFEVTFKGLSGTYNPADGKVALGLKIK